MNISLLTSCTVTRNFEPIVRIADAPIFGTMTELCDWWAGAMREATSEHAESRKTPGELYAGASFTVVTEIAQQIGHDNIFIVTGGVGLSRHTDKIVPYDFTSDKKMEHNAHQHVTGEKFIPHVWWEKINVHLHNSKTPINALLSKTDIIVGALPKAFIKYIIHDLEQIPREELGRRVFIPIPRSMMGSVPKILHDAFVPYDISYTEGLSITRNDKPQRVAQKFIDSISSMEDAMELAKSMRDQVASALPVGVEEIDYAQMFEDNPELLAAPTVESAIHTAKVLGIKFGGRHRFAGVWRGAQGRVEVSASAAEKKAAASALGAVIKTARPKNFVNEDLLLQQLGLFVDAVRTTNPDFIFTAKEVAQWGSYVYPDDKVIGTANKIAHVLNYHAEYLGLVKLDGGSAIGYRVSKET